MDAPLSNIKSLPPYWSWENAVSPEMCDMLLKERSFLEETQAKIGSAGSTLDPLRRKSNVCWVNQNHWVESVLYNHALYANESAGWAFQMGRPERVQLTSYGIDSFYGWHEDWLPLANESNVRKLSVVLLLSDSADFEGGQFEFAGYGPVEMQRGTLIVFPSFLRHQVTPVTKGQRYSAVCWVMGPMSL
jgi:PKHD-type hydroxylase